MRIADYIQDSIVDGPGLRFVLFTQGCYQGCEGCHNKDAQDPMGGREADTADIIGAILSNPLTDGLTLSGGEPFLQPEACAEIAEAAKNHGLNVWCYTGYCLEDLLLSEDLEVWRLMRQIDVLVDGPFIIEQRSLTLPWRGSSNQRILDMRESIKSGVPVLYNIKK